MPNYHCSVKVISRASGRSAVACAAYRANERLHDERLDRTFDYTPRDAVVHSEVMLPDSAPEAYRDREAIWNEVEAAERRRDSQLAREVEVSLPRELPRAEQIDLARDYAQRNFVDEGMCADVCVHDRDGSNPHAHIMVTMRDVGPEGFGKKNRDWNSADRLQEWRTDWERAQNRALERHYERTRAPEQDRAYVDCRSYEDRGVERIPQRHEGPHVREIERKAQEQAREQGREYRPVTEVRRQNIEIAEGNRCIERIGRAVEALRERADQLREQVRDRAQVGLDRAREMLACLREQRPQTQADAHEREQPRRQTFVDAAERRDERQEHTREPTRQRSLADIVAEARESSAALEEARERLDYGREYGYERDHDIGWER